MAADGVANAVIADEVGVTPVTVRAWRKQFVVDGLAGPAREITARVCQVHPHPNARRAGS
ncbi:MAG: helix-turn-helix domain-containing protein [Mycobacterium sp.]